MLNQLQLWVGFLELPEYVVPYKLQWILMEQLLIILHRILYTYSVVASEGVSVFWTVPSAATIISGQNTNSITVSYDLANFDSGSITVQGTNSCGVGSSRSLNVSAVTGEYIRPNKFMFVNNAVYNVPSDLELLSHGHYLKV